MQHYNSTVSFFPFNMPAQQRTTIMLKRFFLIAMVLLFAVPAATAETLKPPNIVVIIVDDMGFSDLGCYGGEIETPNLDRLAANGLRFTQFYNTARCWPTRSALMSGYYPQQIRMDPIKRGAKLPNWAALLPHHLKPLGYRSYHSGKWHVNGAPKVVADGGFDRSYHLTDHDRFFNPQRHENDDQPLPPVEPGSGYYGTTAVADYTLRHLDEHTEKYADKPFFVYTAFLAPHFPLHALPEDIEKYRDKYLPGWDVIRTQRHERQKQAGIVSCALSVREETSGPPYRFENVPGTLGSGEVLFPVAWETLTDEQKRFQATKMAIHAAMIDRVDQEVGRILDKIRQMGAWDDTILFFLSDNGASAEIMIRGDMHDPSAPLGSAASYLCLGPGWATAANTPFRRHKVWNHEGGITTPLIVHWPKGIKKPGTLRHDPGHVIDLAPTILDFLGVAPPKEYQGESVPPFPGVSLFPAIRGDDRPVERDYVFFAHEGNAALRFGDWKVLYTKTGEPREHPPVEGNSGTAGWSLYDLTNDRCEQNDLASRNSEKLLEGVERWRRLNESFRKQAE